MTETRYKIKGCPVPIAQVADTHDTDPDPILASLRAHAPALILHTGDFVCGRTQGCGHMPESRNAVRLLRGCAAIAPTFVSIGNHEACVTQEDLDIVRSTGVTLLDDRFVTLDAGGTRLVIGGFSSAYYTLCRQGGPAALSRRVKMEQIVRGPAPDTRWLEGYAAEEGYHILLMHHPEYFPRIPASIELALSGHAHGGQWRFYDVLHGVWRGLYAPDQGPFPKLTGGVVDGRLVISRGLGDSTWLPRLCNEHELVYIENG